MWFAILISFSLTTGENYSIGTTWGFENERQCMAFAKYFQRELEPDWRGIAICRLST